MFALGQKVRNKLTGMEGTIATVYEGGWYSVGFGTRGFTRELREQNLEAIDAPIVASPALPPVVPPADPVVPPVSEYADDGEG